jgi:hypothetical protein
MQGLDEPPCNPRASDASQKSSSSGDFATNTRRIMTSDIEPRRTSQDSSAAPRDRQPVN